MSSSEIYFNNFFNFKARRECSSLIGVDVGNIKSALWSVQVAAAETLQVDFDSVELTFSLLLFIVNDSMKI